MRERPILFSGPMVRPILNTKPDVWPPEPINPSLPYKSQTRRVIKPQPELGKSWSKGQRWHVIDPDVMDLPITYCPYGVPGDRLWVRETWRVGAWHHHTQQMCVDFKADGFADTRLRDVPDEEQFERLWIQSSDDAGAAGLQIGEDGEYHWEVGQSPTRWRPSIHMPRWASRITLEVKNVRAERVRDISEVDAVMEGWPGGEYARLTAMKVSGNTMSGQAAINWFACLWDSIEAKRGYSWDSNPWVWVTEFGRIR